MRALEWIDRYGDRRRRRVRRVPAPLVTGARQPVLEGLGRLAALPRRPHGRGADRARARCRATSTTPSCGWPSWRATSGASASWPTGSSGRPPSCEQRFDEAFWCEARGGYYALALDAEKRRVDSLTSNIGHLLWSGIVPQERVDAIVDQLMGEELWSGWGVRTMSARGRRLQPARVPQRHGLAPRQLPDRLGPRALRALGRGAAHRPAAAERLVVLRPPAPRGVRRASRARRRPSRFPTRPPRARRPGPRARRCSSSSSCSGSSRTGGATYSARPRPRTSLPGRARFGSSGVRAFDKAWDVHLQDGRVTIEPA